MVVLDQLAPNILAVMREYDDSKASVVNLCWSRRAVCPPWCWRNSTGPHPHPPCATWSIAVVFRDDADPGGFALPLATSKAAPRPQPNYFAEKVEPHRGRDFARTGTFDATED